MAGLVWIVFMAVVAPLLALIHELAHAGAALALMPQHDVVVYLGSDAKITLFKMGRLHILVQLLGAWEGHYGWAAGVVELAKSRAIWIALAGPAASLLMAFACVGLINALREGPVFLYYLAWVSLIQSAFEFVVTLIPMKYPSWWIGHAGRSSDGLVAWHCLFGKGDTVKVWGWPRSAVAGKEESASD